MIAAQQARRAKEVLAFNDERVGAVERYAGGLEAALAEAEERQDTVVERTREAAQAASHSYRLQVSRYRYRWVGGQVGR